MATIPRTGTVHFGNASLSIWEEGPSNRMTHKERGAWELAFKRQVFARIIQTLNRLGWTCTMPEIAPHSVKHYGGNVARWSAERKRLCVKGDLKGDLEVSGRHIEFKMFQSVNCPTRPDNEGRYESDKEGVMPYVLRLEMERTRRRIRDYLCGVMEGYTFEAKKRSIYRKPLEITALEQIKEHYAESWHFKGDWAAWKDKYSAPKWVGCSNGNRKSADGVLLEHGQRVYFFDWHGRIQTGTAMYNINNMWWVVTGKYDYRNEACFHLYARLPENFRVKRNAKRRRARLEKLLAQATKAMNFERAAVLRDILFPNDEQLFVVRHDEHGAYHCSGFSGYTTNLIDAGKFTAAEVKNWDKAPNKVLPLEACHG